MPPKKATAATTKKASAPAEHAPYKDMIKEAILQLKERNGSSRQAIKKYVLNNNKGIKESNFDTQFNAAIKRGVNSGEFHQPKGPSGPVKLQKKEAAKPSAKTTKVVSEKVTKKAAPKKAAAPKKTTTKAAAKPKAAATKAKSTTANSKKPRKTTAVPEKTAAPLTKTKTGRVTKASAKAASTAPPPPAKKAAPKKAASKKKTDSAAPATAE